MAPPQMSEIFPVLAGKVAIITGAAQGMGIVTASIFLKAGAKVVIADIKEESGKKAEEKFKSEGFADVHFVKADISKSADVQALVSQTVEKFGRLDVAVNNAAMTPDNTPMTDFDEDYWNKLMSVNLTGTALCCKYQMQAMIKQETPGAIVNIASINAFKPQPNMPAYTAAKHALLGVTKHAAMEGGQHNIRVNCIAPGAIYSEMSAAALEIMNETEEAFASKICHLNRFGQPFEVGQGSLFLCSDASSYITGVCLPIDGGCLAK